MSITLGSLAVMDNLTRPANDRKRIRALMPSYLKIAGHGETQKIVFARDPYEYRRMVGGMRPVQQRSRRVGDFCGSIESKARLFPIAHTINVDHDGGDYNEGDLAFWIIEDGGTTVLPFPKGYNSPHLPGVNVLSWILRHAENIVYGEAHKTLTGSYPEDHPPTLELYDAGVSQYAVSPELTVCLLRPKIYLLDGKLHRPDGPALEWPSGRASVHAWRGLIIPGWFVRNKDKLTAKAIFGIANMEIRRAVIEMAGPEAILEGNSQRLCSDKYGTLYEIYIGEDTDPIRMVEVVNGTPNRDGSKKKYYLRVPDTIRTPHQGVAWSYGMTPEQYHPDVRT